jgi:MATE family multidrug resistance protein
MELGGRISRYARSGGGVLALSWLLFVPLAQALSFKPGAGWVEWLPHYGFGAIGGWFAALIYICSMGTILFLRWRSGAWRRKVRG